MELASGGVVAARVNLGESSKVRCEQLLSEMTEKGFAEIGDAFVFKTAGWRDGEQESA